MATRRSFAALASVAIILVSPLAWSQSESGLIEAIPLSVESIGSLSVVYQKARDDLPERILVQGVSAEVIGETGEEDADRNGVLALYTKLPGEDSVPPIFGKVRWTDNQVEFLPRFSLQAGIPYYVSVSSELLVTRNHDTKPYGDPEYYTFTIPKKKLKPVATVKAVFPSASELPENLLKFYLHFTHPMSGGDVYSHIRLLNQEGEEIDLPFLELGEELWDRENRRLTLLFDPGRIKSGLMPRREEGAVLEKGKRYTLQILNTWLDAKGRPLRERFEKHFVAIEPDGDSPLIDRWQLRIPKADTRAPLQVDFREPLDEALLHRVIEIVKSDGVTVAGVSTVENCEQSWLFAPSSLWNKGSYRIRVGTILEDLAGNSIGRPFEVDLQESRRLRPEPFAYRDFAIE